ncbi:Gfo/Idh/MocA family protein [Christiangramia forsetii]|uniref:Glucose--fructose oxidoreductase n=2 Tax=Christiangramia forsetii TaxID=411153 RepID=A0M3G5_CHRFK|nr:Gfo/Idh/MocA family oxidoreductase [Christiangramia forsetii]GGG25912.1 glucose-fructose oxidoreductase [Christiangramia forsetii]CAL67160.1 glucose--fructose oxidoreductase [Christiangramia forsetii KT0803]
MSSRRNFIKRSGLLLGAAVLPFPGCIAAESKEKLGIALVGLGYYSRDLLAPALQLTDHCELKGIVTGSQEKIPVWQKKYGIKDSNVYNYQNMHEISNNDEIDVIYIVLPTGLHAKYAIKAANTGKHVWCEKPMARTANECQQIIEACNKNRVKLSIGYRMQHEVNTQTIMKWAKTQPYGEIQQVISEAGYNGGSINPWKLKKEMGGGAIYDMGVYSINAARYSTGLEPIAVTAKQSTNRPDIFTEVDETTSYKMEFPNGIIVDGKTSFGESLNNLEVTTKNGWYYLRPMQSYSGVRGKTSNGKILTPMRKNQQAVQMDDDALAILNNTEVLVSGEEGMKDIHIVEKINKASATGQRIQI